MMIPGSPSAEPTPAARNPNLKPCSACHQPMAKGARTCPHCGKSYTNLTGIIIAIFIGLLLGGFFLVRK